MYTMPDTTVRIDDETHDRLAALKSDRDGTSFDRLINDLIDASAKTALWSDDGERAELVDELTEPLRREIAGLEIELGHVDSSQSLSERVEELAGSEPSKLRARAERLSRERLWDVRGSLPESETRERYADLSEEEKRAVIEDMAKACLTTEEVRDAHDAGLSSAEYVSKHYGLQPELYPTEQHLQTAMSAVRSGPTGLPKTGDGGDTYTGEDDAPGVLRGVKTALNRTHSDGSTEDN